MTGDLTMFTIYHRPDDMPDVAYVVRAWTSASGSGGGHLLTADVVGTATTLPGARALIPPSAGVCLPRADDDARAIVESWL